MKILLLVFTLFYSQSLFAKIYYCIEEDATGYNVANNYKITNFAPKRFSADIDFNNLSIVAHDILFDTTLLPHVCKRINSDYIMQCMNGMGYSFTINIKTLKFVKSFGYSYVDDEPNNDDMALSYGKCESF